MKANECVIAAAIDYLVAHYAEQPDLDELARKAGYEATHFQKLFREKVGISPKRLVQYMTMRRARDLLSGGTPLPEAACEAGLSGEGRLYDLFVTCEAATPGEVRQRGEGMTVTYGYHASPLGEILVGITPRGVCWLGFLVNEDRAVPFRRMEKHWPRAQFAQDEKATAPAAEQILSIWRGRGDQTQKLKLDLHGTNFQIQVWQALLKIPLGEFLSYQDIAMQIGNPKASRAVGGAVGSNPISLLIPCHRVIQASGIIDNYGWGSARKKAILGIEGALAA